jgi:hypothetical protein
VPANTTKIAITASPLSLISVFIAFAASATPMMPAIVEFLHSAIRTLPSGATTARPACGRMMIRSVWANVSPIARAASACPAGTVLMPERTASHTNAAV